MRFQVCSFSKDFPGLYIFSRHFTSKKARFVTTTIIYLDTDLRYRSEPLHHLQGTLCHRGSAGDWYRFEIGVVFHPRTKHCMRSSPSRQTNCRPLIDTVYKKLLDEDFVISGIIKAEVETIHRHPDYCQQIQFLSSL